MARDENGNPYMLWWIKGASGEAFSSDCDAVGVDEVRIRLAAYDGGGFRARFTAYRDGRCVTEEVIDHANARIAAVK